MTTDRASTVRNNGPGTHELRYPGDIYSALGGIVVLVERLPVMLALLDQTFTGLVEAGHVKVEEGEFTGDAPAAAAVLSTHLGDAVAAAVGLREALGHAQQTVAAAAWDN